MSDIIIAVENLSKRYLVGHHSAQFKDYTTLRDVIAHETRNFARKAVDFVRGRQIVQGDAVEELWALKDVSFEVKRGEMLGIIGRNGAGKSTLLKILSRITEPDRGRAILRGRVASLLEVGTGFHPELTGRENIYLNGAILGMTKVEIKSKFDEIVAFSEVERFIDTPVKRYSSGMYVRLAFAVAAHLEPDILVVDEVLAVGDLEFQKKCLRKMDDSAKGGQTVLFVSHDMRNATALCHRGLLLNAGMIECDGKMSEVAHKYQMQQVVSKGVADLTQRQDRSGSGNARFESIELLSGDQTCRTFVFGEPLVQTINIRVHKRFGEAVIASVITFADGVPIYRLSNIDTDFRWIAEVGYYSFTVEIESLLLYPGTYSIDLWIGDRNFERVDYIPQAISFSVIQDANSGLERVLDPSEGLVFQQAQWKWH